MRVSEEFRYETPIRFRLDVLREVVQEVSGDASATVTAKNNITKLYERLSGQTCFAENPDEFLGRMEGHAKGNTCRVYYAPSYTQAPRAARKAIVPVGEGNRFVYLDIKSAEYILNSYFAGDKGTISAYEEGEDVYLLYSKYFPEGSSRKVMKEALIGGMYGLTPFTLSKKLGCSEREAKGLLSLIVYYRKESTQLNNYIISTVKNVGWYVCPNGFDDEDLVKVAPVDFSDRKWVNRAFSIYTQSALGLWMQSRIRLLQEKLGESFTLIQVFDSLLFEVPKGAEEEQVINEIKELVSPFRVEVGFGDNFYEAQMSAKSV